MEKENLKLNPSKLHCSAFLIASVQKQKIMAQRNINLGLICLLKTS